MNPTNLKRSIVLNGHKTSVSLEKEFWNGLREIAALQNTKLTKLVQQIDKGRNGGNLSSAIRVFVFNQLRAASPRSSLIDEEDLKDRTRGGRSRKPSRDNAPRP
ncbi:MAG: ribbon-helix-helix domain-containing protein [Clostridia bacterium]|nr:ribbon-helix-helix domain-containing protein [Clostridia bacterium]